MIFVMQFSCTWSSLSRLRVATPKRFVNMLTQVTCSVKQSLFAAFKFTIRRASVQKTPKFHHVCTWPICSGNCLALALLKLNYPWTSSQPHTNYFLIGSYEPGNNFLYWQFNGACTFQDGFCHHVGLWWLLPSLHYLTNPHQVWWWCHRTQSSCQDNHWSITRTLNGGWNFGNYSRYAFN